MVWPSRTEATGQEKSAKALERLNRTGDSKEQGQVFFPVTRVGARESDALPMRLSRRGIDDTSLHSFCG